MVFGKSAAQSAYIQEYFDLITSLVNELGLNERFLQAAIKYPRFEFLSPEKRHLAAVDAPIPLWQGQTASQPYTILYMLKLLDPKPGEKVLEIGAGSGWQTALLSYLVQPGGKVVAFEVVPSLYEFAKKNLERLGIKNVELVLGSPLQPEFLEKNRGRFNRVIAGAGFSDQAISQIAQFLKDQGVAVIPHKDGGLVYLKRHGTNITTRYIPGFVFVRGRE